MSATEQTLATSMFNRYGPLLTLAQLAQMLNRSTDGMRMALRETSSYAEQLNAAKVRIGRRIYFRTSDVAAVFMQVG